MPAPHDSPLILCYDGSEPAKHAIQRAADLLEPRHVLVLTVWQPTAVFAPGLGGVANALNFVEIDRAAADESCRTAEEGVRIARDRGLDAEPVTVEATGPVWHTIVETADRHDAAAIVMGSRGLTALRSMLLGSVSGGVVHHADRPTLVIHRPSDGPRSAGTEPGGGSPPLPPPRQVQRMWPYCPERRETTVNVGSNEAGARREPGRLPTPSGTHRASRSRLGGSSPSSAPPSSLYGWQSGAREHPPAPGPTCRRCRLASARKREGLRLDRGSRALSRHGTAVCRGTSRNTRDPLLQVRPLPPRPAHGPRRLGLQT
jgi:nucleotide-binding universal stress UspA family protein